MIGFLHETGSHTHPRNSVVCLSQMSGCNGHFHPKHIDLPEDLFQHVASYHCRSICHCCRYTAAGVVFYPKDTLLSISTWTVSTVQCRAQELMPSLYAPHLLDKPESTMLCQSAQIIRCWTFHTKADSNGIHREECSSGVEAHKKARH